MNVDKVIQTAGARLVVGLTMHLAEPDKITWHEILNRLRADVGHDGRVRVVVNGRHDLLDMPAGDIPAFGPYMFAVPLLINPGMVVELETPDGLLAKLVDADEPTMARFFQVHQEFGL